MPSSSSEQLALAFIQLARSLHSHFDEQIAFAVSVEDGHTLAPDAQRGARLSAFRHLQRLWAFKSGNTDFHAQRRLRK